MHVRAEAVHVSDCQRSEVSTFYSFTTFHGVIFKILQLTVDTESSSPTAVSEDLESPFWAFGRDPGNGKIIIAKQPAQQQILLQIVLQPSSDSPSPAMQHKLVNSTQLNPNRLADTRKASDESHWWSPKDGVHYPIVPSSQFEEKANQAKRPTACKRSKLTIVPQFQD